MGGARVALTGGARPKWIYISPARRPAPGRRPDLAQYRYGGGREGRGWDRDR